MPTDLGQIGEFKDRGVCVVTVGSREFGVVRWGNDIFVFRNICPHMNGPIGKGVALPKLGGAGVGELSVTESDPVAVCPWHQWEFDLRSGQAVRDRRYRLKKYDARVEDGHVIAELPSSTVLREVR